MKLVKAGLFGINFFLFCFILIMLNIGWMSNRGRQNVASFLAKDLEIDWRYFDFLNLFTLYLSLSHLVQNHI